MAVMKADVALTALVPVPSQFARQIPPVPTWPFTYFETASGTPLRATCVAGNEIDFAVHSFAKPRESGGQVVETAEDHCGRIGSAVVAALDGQILALDGGGTIKIRSAMFRLLSDPEEADAFHHIAEFTARVLA